MLVVALSKRFKDSYSLDLCHVFTAGSHLHRPTILSWADAARLKEVPMSKPVFDCLLGPIKRRRNKQDKRNFNFGGTL